VRVATAISVFAVALAGCGKKPSPPVAAQTPSASQIAVIDPCALLTDADVEGVQQSPVKDKKGAAQSSGGLRTSQCFYATVESNRSVSLSITQTDASSGTLNVNAYWKQTFGRFDDGLDGKQLADKEDDEPKKSVVERRRQEEEQESAPPERVAGLGDRAFWSTNRVGGALYVLKKDKGVFLRISVGGPDSPDKKLDKSKKLAAKVLERL
jgi:hypothetical protein